MDRLEPSIGKLSVRLPSNLPLLETTVLLLLARAAVAIFPLRWIRGALGLTSSVDSTYSSSEHARATAARIEALVTEACRRRPMMYGCLPQALAAAAMLRLRGISSTLHFGVLRGPAPSSPLTAHAWLTVHDVVVTGADLRSAFVALTARR